ncbi:MAG: Hsp20/alpha crystallin family protein [Bacilli bacterium]|nr:Hsp20/alpha crystallin family protein [Bacilli bacterium]MBR3049531.1 Hsp20/alpha crystallin family protein [Bacilli bacterium]
MDLIPRRFYLDDIFDDFMPSRRNDNMKCDIYEKDGNYHIEMDIPGFKKEDISIEVDDGYLTIEAEKNIENNEENEDRNYIRRERSYNSYKRSFYLGDLDQDSIEAKFNDGMLNITVPKKELTSNKKKIDII